MNKKQKEYIRKHNAKIERQQRMNDPTFAKSDNVKWIYENVPSLRKRIEKEG